VVEVGDLVGIEDAQGARWMAYAKSYVWFAQDESWDLPLGERLMWRPVNGALATKKTGCSIIHFWMSSGMES